jgi:hypothetical protein
LRPKRRIPSFAQGEREKKQRIQPFCPQKGDIDRAKALTVPLLWMFVDSRGKGAKRLPTASRSS